MTTMTNEQIEQKKQSITDIQVGKNVRHYKIIS